MTTTSEVGQRDREELLRVNASHGEPGKIGSGNM
jgi:hypothetical protein